MGRNICCRSASRLGPTAMTNLPMKGQPDSLIKDFTKKRWLILSLLSVEIEILVTHQVRVCDSFKNVLHHFGH